MKNKSPRDESIFKKKGFYYTLYGSLGVAMVLAAVVSFTNLSAFNKPSVADGTTNKMDLSQLEATNKSSTKSYLTQLEDQLDDEYTLETPYVEKDVTSEGISKARPVDSSIQAGNEATKPVESGKPSQPGATPGATPGTTPNPVPSAAPNTNPNAPKVNEQKVPEPAKPEAPVDKKKQSEANNSKEQAFNKFEDGSKMLWPINGEVVMEFSNNHAIYDSTLNQFRTNDTICISAEQGTQVKAAADGVVKSVTTSREYGNTVVIDNGNGWTTTYSQLQDGVLVKEGDIVAKSQVIGGVGDPSIYSVLLGNHLSFKVCKDEEAVNPLTLLAE